MHTSGLRSAAIVLALIVSAGAAYGGQNTKATDQQALVNRYCLSCHNDRAMRGNLSLEQAPLAEITDHLDVWEKALKKLRAGAMPPDGAPRPEPEHYAGLVRYLETTLDTLAQADPNPGRTETFRRLNRTEYRNAVRDLLDLDVDVATLLPRDDDGIPGCTFLVDVVSHAARQAKV